MGAIFVAEDDKCRETAVSLEIAVIPGRRPMERERIEDDSLKNVTWSREREIYCRILERSLSYVPSSFFLDFASSLHYYKSTLTDYLSKSVVEYVYTSVWVDGVAPYQG